MKKKYKTSPFLLISIGGLTGILAVTLAAFFYQSNCKKNPIPLDQSTNADTMTNTEAPMLLTINSDTVYEIICTNSCFPSDWNVVITEEEEINAIVSAINELSFIYLTDRQDNPSVEPADGGSSQLLEFYDNQGKLVECLAIENDTELSINTDEGKRYFCTLPIRSTLYEKITKMVDLYWKNSYDPS